MGWSDLSDDDVELPKPLEPTQPILQGTYSAGPSSQERNRSRSPMQGSIFARSAVLGRQLIRRVSGEPDDEPPCPRLLDGCAWWQAALWRSLLHHRTDIPATSLKA